MLGDSSTQLRRASSTSSSSMANRKSGMLQKIRAQVVDEVVALGSDPQALERALRETQEDEADIKGKVTAALLDSMALVDKAAGSNAAVERNLELEKAMDGLRYSIPTLQVVFQGASKLDARITETREMADVVSKRVREIDLARSRALLALGKVKRLLELRTCLKGVKESVNDRNLESASDFIYRYRQSELGEGATSGNLEGDAQVDAEFRSCEETVRQAAVDELNRAIEYREEENVITMCRIFAKLGLAKEGVTRLLEYRCEQLHKDVSLEMEVTIAQFESRSRTYEYGHGELGDEENPEEKTFLTLLIYLINQGAASIQRTSNVVKRNVSTSADLQSLVVTTIHSECEKLMTEILRLFVEKNRIEEKVRMIRSNHERLGEAMSLGAQFSVDSEKSEALRFLFDLLDKMALSLKHTETYSRFIESRYKDLANAVEADSNGQTSTVFTPSYQGEYINVVQEIAGFYAILEEVYMTVGLETALHREIASRRLSTPDEGQISSDSHEPPEESFDALMSKHVIVSSVAEEAFFVIKLGIDRAKTTAHIESACAVVNNTVKLLDDVLGNVLQTRVLNIRENPGSLSAQGQDQFDRIRAAALSQAQALSGAPSPGRNAAATTGRSSHRPDDNGDTLKAAETVLNSVSLCIINTNKLRIDLEQFAESLEDNRKRMMLKNCADGLMETAEGYRSTLATGLDRWFGSAKPKLREQIEGSLGSTAVRFEITFEEYESQCSNTSESFVWPLLKLTDSMIEEISVRLDISNSNNIAHRVAGFVAKTVELVIVRKKFSQFGALLLDKQMRDIVRFFDGRCGSQTKTIFKRVQQISDLLNLDQVEDVHDVFIESASGLGSKEVKRVLALRTDFKNEDIKRLKI